jgi:hypothetical protein
MISKEEKKLIIETLGSQYTPKVMPWLKKMKLKNEKKEDYSASSLRMIINGLRENQKVELAIMQLVKETNKDKKAMALKRKRLLKK